MGFWSWLTGHSEKESDVYANYDKVAIVTEELYNVATTGVQNASVEVVNAIQRLNSVPGFSQYVGSIPANSYISMFDSLSESIIGISRGITDKAEGIKAFNEASIFEKIGSTACMGLFKAGEGLLSVGEGLVDSVASVVGWTAGLLGSKEFQSDVAKFVEKDYSHDLFNFYYNSDFAKSSLFTEDSALAGACKLVGQTVGYLYAGGVMAGIGSAAGLGSTAVGTLASGIASSSTWGATVAGALGGLGNTMESNLKLGLDYNSAMKGAAVVGAIQGGLAFAGGKLGEHLAKSAAVKQAQVAADKADEALKVAQGSAKAATSGVKATDGALVVADKLDDAARAASSASKSVTVAEAEQASKAAHAALDAAKSAKVSSFQGYSDSITRAGQEFGKAQVNTAKAGVKAAVENAKAATAGVRKLNPVETEAVRQSAQAANQSLKTEFSNLVKNANPLSQGVEGVKNVAGNIKAGVSKTIEGVKTNGLRSTVTTGLNDAKAGITSSIQALGKDGIGATLKGAVAGISPVVPGIAATTLGSAVQDVATAPAYSLDRVTPNPIQTGVADGTFSNLTNEALKGIDTSQLSAIPDNIVPPSVTPATPDTPTPTPTLAPTATYTPTYSSPSGGSPSGGSSPSGGGGGGYTPYSPIDSTPYTYTPYSPSELTFTPYSPSYLDYRKTTPTYTTEPYTQPTYSYPSYDYPSYEYPSYTHSSVADPVSSLPGNNSDGTHSGVAYDGLGANSLGELGALAGSENLAELDEDSEDAIIKGSSSLDEIIKGSKFMKVPDATRPTPKGKTARSSAVPIAAGLSAAAAAGLGAKAYLDARRIEEEDEYDEDEISDDDDFFTESWDENANTLDVGTEEIAAMAGEGVEEKPPTDEYYDSNEMYPYYFGLTHDFDLQEDE